MNTVWIFSATRKYSVWVFWKMQLPRTAKKTIISRKIRQQHFLAEENIRTVFIPIVFECTNTPERFPPLFIVSCASAFGAKWNKFLSQNHTFWSQNQLLQYFAPKIAENVTTFEIFLGQSLYSVWKLVLTIPIDFYDIQDRFKGLIPSVISIFTQKPTFDTKIDCKISQAFVFFDIVPNSFRL